MNGEKLFKSMNNINQEWIEQAKPADKPVIMRTRSKIYRNIAAAAAAVIAISGLTTLVYTRTRSILSQRVMSILNLILAGIVRLMFIIQVMLHLQKNLMLTWNGENMLLMVEDFILN
jgi:high-affinity Fe2+/Pb2+ permease